MKQMLAALNFSKVNDIVKSESGLILIFENAYRWIPKGLPCSAETRQKISNSLKGKPLRSETKVKIGIGNKGNSNPAHI